MPTANPSFVSVPVVSTVQMNIGSAVLFGPVGFGWGANTSGQIGDGTATNRSSPVVIAGSIPFSRMAMGEYHSLGINSLDDSGWSWGLNTSGQVGDNSATSRSSPVSIIGSHFFTRLIGGINFSVSIKIDGSTWAWGLATNGVIGDNQTAANRSSPVSVLGAHSFSDISAGGHAMAIKTDGTAWAWGLNGNGQIGDNSATSRSSPVSAVGAHSFIQVSAGQKTTAALKSGGDVWCWGLNTHGEVGDNSTTDRSSPVSVAGAHSFIEVRFGHYHVAALKADGTVWTWGINNVAEAGDGTIANRSSPVSVLGGHSFIDITGNLGVIFGRKADGSIWTWGYNTLGQLADGTLLHRTSPVSILNNNIFPDTPASTMGRHFAGPSWGPTKLLLTAASTGTRIDTIVIQAGATTTAGMIRFWMGSSITSLQLIKEVPVTAVTPSSTAVAFSQMIGMGIVIPSGQSLYAATNNFEIFSLTVNAGNL